VAGHDKVRGIGHHLAARRRAGDSLAGDAGSIGARADEIGAERALVATGVRGRRSSRCRTSNRGWNSTIDTHHPGAMPIEIDEGVGQPSRWNTLRALRLLRSYSA
jgi:hypothetical protein